MIHFDLTMLSKRRTQIMGFAMLSVVFFHSGFDLSMIPLLQLLKQWGDIGVDIFLVMSGIGIYHSLSRKPDVSSYLRSRVRRIVPAHLLVSSVWFFFLDMILYKEGFVTFLMDVTSLSFWINGRLTTWYLSSLLVMQFLSPFYVNLWKKHPALDRVAIPVVILGCLCITYTPALNQALEHLLIAFYRIPAFLVGLSIGRRICENRSTLSISAPLGLLLLGGSICILVISSGLTPLYLRWVLRYAVYLPIALALCFAVIHVPENKLFRYFGTRSLEIFLLHDKVVWVTTILARRIWGEGPLRCAIVNVLAILIACIGAEILHRVIVLIFSEKRREPIV